MGYTYKDSPLPWVRSDYSKLEFEHYSCRPCSSIELEVFHNRGHWDFRINFHLGSQRLNITPVMQSVSLKSFRAAEKRVLKTMSIMGAELKIASFAIEGTGVFNNADSLIKMEAAKRDRQRHMDKQASTAT